ncbi:MAG: uracil-DNA glycosylase [Caulobacterales bacterium]|jgi:DNA polymerase
MIDAVDPRLDAFEALTGFWEEAGLESLPALGPAPSARDAAPAFEQIRLPPPSTPSRRRSDPVADARQLAAAAGDLTALAAAIAAFDGCSLKKGSRRTVFADGIAGAPVMVVGEAPGTEDDELGRPFLGPPGKLMDKMLAAIGLSRTANVFLTNVVFWRPPGARTPTQGEIAACLPFVERAIQLARPKVLILAGGLAAEAVLKRTEGVMKLRGRRLKHVYPELTEPLNAMVMLDPVYLLKHRRQDKALAWADLIALEAWLAELGVETHRPV